MPRSRVLSFMSEWRMSAGDSSPPSPTREAAPAKRPPNIDLAASRPTNKPLDNLPQPSPRSPGSPVAAGPGTPTRSRARGDSRVNLSAGTRDSMLLQHSYQPPHVDVANDTPPELAPIFSYLNSHSNKLYQEGYFLKLHDLDSRGRPSPDRVWVECFAQLVGTVLSLWDAALLDQAGEDGEVVPTFINLSDASIKMIESLPMSGGAAGGNLQNVLSVSTAANNRYLLHFNSYSSLTQWTAGIRLAMFEHATLQEAYTGSLIAGKGKYLNNIKAIMERSRFAHEDWARVRFGAGTPWRRCWCVVSPPDDKEFQKAQKSIKKGSAYGRAALPKGDIKFYDTRKITKKTKPIATVSDAYAAYAIYPQSKPLIDQSTLVKLEGLVTIHSTPETTTEGFIFVMPEVHPAVTGFEMMMRWLFPVYDTFGLYGRPTRLIADTLDQRGLMFAMPRDRRYGYLDVLDVSGLIHATGSQNWPDRQWRREMKKLTSTRMMNRADGAASPANGGHVNHRRTNTMNSRMPERSGVRFDEVDTSYSTPGSRTGSPPASLSQNDLTAPMRVDSAPPGVMLGQHKRSASDSRGLRRQVQPPSRLSQESSRPGDEEMGPPPPRHGVPLGPGPGRLERIKSGDEIPTVNAAFADLHTQSATPDHLQPVISPPAFTHSPNSKPVNQPVVAPELRRMHSNVDSETLHQMRDAARERPLSRDSGDHAPTYGGVYEQPQQQLPPEQYQQLPYRGLASVDATSDIRERANRYEGPPIINGSKPHDPPQRLSTISQLSRSGQEDDGGFVQPVADEGLRSATGGDYTSTFGSQQMPTTSLHSAKSLARKPVGSGKAQQSTPLRSSTEANQVSEESDAPSPDSHGSFAGALLDEDALERILNHPGEDERNSTMKSKQSYASTAPSYSSEPEPQPPALPVERPRAGKLKTVGDPGMTKGEIMAGRLESRKVGPSDNPDIPEVDFGPTHTYRPSGRPGTSCTVTADNLANDSSRSSSRDRLRNVSGDRLTPSHSRTPSRLSPGEANRSSYFGGGSSPNGPSPGREEAQLATPAATQRLSMTPEQWVQYRASLAAEPQRPPPRKAVPPYAHERAQSSASLQQLRKSSRTPPPALNTPPLTRVPSGDWTQYAGITPPARPHSRGPSQGLASMPPTQLSAKEQMHVARATGTPLLNMAANLGPKQQDESGLVGGIAQREREKAAMRNMSSETVQQAINSRQEQQQAEAINRQQMYMQQQALQQYQMQQQQVYQQQRMMNQQQQGYPQSRASWYGGMPSPGGWPQGQQQQASPSAWQQAPPQPYRPQAPGGYADPAPQLPRNGGQQQMMQPGQTTPKQAYGASYFAQQAAQQATQQQQQQQQQQQRQGAQWKIWR